MKSEIKMTLLWVSFSITLGMIQNILNGRHRYLYHNKYIKQLNMSIPTITTANMMDLIELHNCNKNNLPIYYSVDDYLQMLDSPDYLLCVARINDIVIGYATIRQYHDYCHIMSFGIDKEFRRKKIGTKILDYIKEQINVKKLTLFVYIVNVVAIDFYEKNGFTIVKILKDYCRGINGMENLMVGSVDKNDGYCHNACMMVWENK